MYSYIGTHTGRQVTSKAKQSTCQDAEPPFLHPRKPFASRPQTRHLLCARTVHSTQYFVRVGLLFGSPGNGNRSRMSLQFPGNPKRRALVASPALRTSQLSQTCRIPLSTLGAQSWRRAGVTSAFQGPPSSGESRRQAARRATMPSERSLAP
jgi:hypothetical protein